jgi:hypothetical protein
VIALPYYNLWTGVASGISSNRLEQLCRCGSVARDSRLSRVGEVGVWVGEAIGSASLPLIPEEKMVGDRNRSLGLILEWKMMK